MPEVSVVILNWNGGELTREAIISVLNQHGVAAEVIVVDNGSTDGSREKIKEEFKGRIRMIENHENIGFSPANNQGFQAASGDWVCLLNNDAVADPAWLKTSLLRAKSAAKVGLVAPRILRYFDREELDGIGVGFWRDGLSRARHRGEIDSPRLDRERALIPSGCACLLSKKMLEELKGFDPNFFIYSEDTDLGIRAFLSGWECLFEPKAVIYHRYSKATARQTGYSPFKLSLVERNRFWILIRYYPVHMILGSFLTSPIRLIYQALQALSLPGRGSALTSAWALFKAVFGAFATLPGQLTRRKQWLSKPGAKSAVSRAIFDHFIPLKEISRLD